MARCFMALARLPSSERSLLLRACLSLIGIEIGLRWYGYNGLLQRIERPPNRSNVTGKDRERATEYARGIAKAARHHVILARCLHKSLTLHAWLRKEGLPSQLRIGVRKDGGQLQAHAWIELGDQIVNDAPEVSGTYAPLRVPA